MVSVLYACAQVLMMLFAYDDPPDVIVSLAVADGPAKAIDATRAETATTALAERRIYSPCLM
jgi:hypothetical protein